MKEVIKILVLLLVCIFASTKSRRRRCRAAVYAIERPTNGRILVCCKFKRIKFVCNPGYKLVDGGEILKCKKGRIYGKFPKCVLGHEQKCGLAGFGRLGGRIAGGMKNAPGDWPWMAAIYRNDQFICGGALISQTHILTAAHCFYTYFGLNNDPKKYRVWLGRTRLNKDEDGQKQVAFPSNIYTHKHFRFSTFDHDVAIIQLSKPVKFSFYVRPICLPNKEEGNPGRYTYVAGWGSTKKHNDHYTVPKYSNVLNYVKMPITPDEKCSRSVPHDAVFNNKTMLCAGDGEGERDACFGDSGGPLVSFESVKGIDGNWFDKWTAIGIVSWGDGCAVKNKYGYYARVFNYIDWIKRIVGIQ